MGKKYIFLNTLLLALFIMINIYYEIKITIPFLILYLICFILIYGKKAVTLPIVLVVSFAFNYKPPIKTEDICNEYYHQAIVKDVYSTSMTVVEDDHIYYLMKIDKDIVRGDVVSYSTSGKYKTQVNEKGSFDMFYRSTGADAYGYLKAGTLKIIEPKESMRNNIYHDLIEDQGWYSDMTLLLLYGKEKGSGVIAKRRINSMGVAHLFVVSGFHISLMYIMMEMIGKNFIRNNKFNSLLAFAISTSFLYLVYFPPTGIRALITLLIIRTNRYDKVDSLSLTGILFFVINPWIMFSSSMILSYSITAAIYLFRPSKISASDTITLSMFAFFISLPTISTWESEHNLLAPLLSIAMTPLVSTMYVASLVALPFHGLWSLMDPIFYVFFRIIIIFSELQMPFSIGIIGFSKQVALTIICVLYIGLLKENKWILLTTFFSISFIIFLI